MNFITVYKTYFKFVYRYLRRRLLNADDAEEVTLIVFEAIWKDLSRLEEGRNVQAWVFGIARHKLYDFFRKRYRLTEQEVSFSELNEYQLSEASNDVTVVAEKRIPILQELVSELKEVDKRIVELRYKANWTYADIAEELGMTANNVKVRHNRLIKKLYETWQQKI